MKRRKCSTIVIAGLSLLCVALTAYIAIEHFGKRDAGISECLPRLAVSDFDWYLSDFSVDRSPVRLIQGRALQEHWGEYEFAILEAALDSFTPLDADIIPPWYVHNVPRWWHERTDAPFTWHSPWWHRNNRPIVPFDTIFTLSPDAKTPHGRRIGIAPFNFGFSEEYGAFAWARFFGLLHSDISDLTEYFRMDADAFFALLSIIELGEARFPFFP